MIGTIRDIIRYKALCWNNRRSRLTHNDPCWSNTQCYSSINIQSSLLGQRAAIGKLILHSWKASTGNSIGTIIQSVIWSELNSHYHRTRRKYDRETRECDVNWQPWMIVQNVKPIFLKQNIEKMQSRPIDRLWLRWCLCEIGAGTR